MARQQEQPQIVDPLAGLFANLEKQLAAAAETEIKVIKKRDRHAPKWETVMNEFEETPTAESFTPTELVGFVKAFFRKAGKKQAPEVGSLVTTMTTATKDIKRSTDIIQNIDKRLEEAAARFDGGRGVITVDTLLAQSKKFPAIKQAMDLRKAEELKIEEAIRVLAQTKEQLRVQLRPLIHDIRANESLMAAKNGEELEEWEAIFGKLSEKKDLSVENIEEQEKQFLDGMTSPGTPDFISYRHELMRGTLPKDEVDRTSVERYLQEKWAAKKLIAEGKQKVDRDVATFRASGVQSGQAEVWKHFSNGGKPIAEFSSFIMALCKLPTAADREYYSPSQLIDAQEQRFRQASAYLVYETKLVAAREVIFKRYLKRLKSILERGLPGDDEVSKVRREAIYQRFLNVNVPIKVIVPPVGDTGSPRIDFIKQLFEEVPDEVSQEIVKLFVETNLLEKISEPWQSRSQYNREPTRKKYSAVVDAYFALLGGLDKKDLIDNAFDKTKEALWKIDGWNGQNEKALLERKRDEGVAANPGLVNDMDAILKFVLPTVPHELMDPTLPEASSANPLYANNGSGGSFLTIKALQREGGNFSDDPTLFPAGKSADLVKLRAQRQAFVLELAKTEKKLTGEMPEISRLGERKTARGRVHDAEAQALTEMRRAQALEDRVHQLELLNTALTTDLGKARKDWKEMYDARTKDVEDRQEEQRKARERATKDLHEIVVLQQTAALEKQEKDEQRKRLEAALLEEGWGSGDKLEAAVAGVLGVDPKKIKTWRKETKQAQKEALQKQQKT